MFFSIHIQFPILRSIVQENGNRAHHRHLSTTRVRQLPFAGTYKMRSGLAIVKYFLTDIERRVSGIRHDDFSLKGTRGCFVIRCSFLARYCPEKGRKNAENQHYFCGLLDLLGKANMRYASEIHKKTPKNYASSQKHLGIYLFRLLILTSAGK